MEITKVFVLPFSKEFLLLYTKVHLLYLPFAAFAPRLTVDFVVIVLGNTMSLSVSLLLPIPGEERFEAEVWEDL